MFRLWTELTDELRAMLAQMIRSAREEGVFNDLFQCGAEYQFAVVEMRTGTVYASDIAEPSNRALARLPRIGTIDAHRHFPHH